MAPGERDAPEAQPRLGRYAVTGQLGEGGRGCILQLRDDDLGREVAAKVLRDRIDPATLEAFIREAQVTAQLEHPNILPVYELGLTPERQTYITLKRVQGRTLWEILDEDQGGHIRVPELLQILLKVCDAASFAHSRGVIHRDLKPDNIMIGRFGEVLVMDWGLAHLEGQPQMPERPEEPVVGTPAYMPPEQARGEVEKLDRRADIYTLGATLYQMLTGQPPYTGDCPEAVLRQVIEGPPVSPSRRAPERRIPWELEAVVLKAMARRPQDRYESVAGMQADLACYLEGRTLEAARYSPWQVLRKWAARNKVAALATMLVMLAVGFAGQEHQRRETVAQRDQARQQLKAARQELQALQRQDAGPGARPHK